MSHKMIVFHCSTAPCGLQSIFMAIISYNVLRPSLWLPGNSIIQISQQQISSTIRLYFSQALLSFLLSCLSLPILHSWRVMTILSNLKNISLLSLSLHPAQETVSLYWLMIFSQSDFLPVGEALGGLGTLFCVLARIYSL